MVPPATGRKTRRLPGRVIDAGGNIAIVVSAVSYSLLTRHGFCVLNVD
jgi:hypothetical protein